MRLCVITYAWIWCYSDAYFPDGLDFRCALLSIFCYFATFPSYVPFYSIPVYSCRHDCILWLVMVMDWNLLFLSISLLQCPLIAVRGLLRIPLPVYGIPALLCPISDCIPVCLLNHIACCSHCVYLCLETCPIVCVSLTLYLPYMLRVRVYALVDEISYSDTGWRCTETYPGGLFTIHELHPWGPPSLASYPVNNRIGCTYFCIHERNRPLWTPSIFSLFSYLYLAFLSAYQYFLFFGALCCLYSVISPLFPPTYRFILYKCTPANMISYADLWRWWTEIIFLVGHLSLWTPCLIASFAGCSSYRPCGWVDVLLCPWGRSPTVDSFWLSTLSCVSFLNEITFAAKMCCFHLLPHCPVSHSFAHSNWALMAHICILVYHCSSRAVVYLK